MPRFIQLILDYLAKIFLSGVSKYQLIALLLVAEVFESSTLLAFLHYESLIESSIRIVCMPVSFHFWNILGKYLLYTTLPSFIFFTIFIQTSSRCINYFLVFSVISGILRSFIILFGLIFMPLLNVSGAVIRENEFSNILFQFNYGLFRPQAFPIFIGEGPFNLYGFNLTKNPAILDSTHTRSLMNFSNICHSYNSSMLNEMSILFRSQKPFDKSLELFESHFAELYTPSCLVMLCGVGFVSMILILVFRIIYKNRHSFKQHILLPNQSENTESNE